MSYEKKFICNIHGANNICIQLYDIGGDKLEYITCYPNGKIKERLIRNAKTEEIILKEDFNENGKKIKENDHIEDGFTNLENIQIPYDSNSSVNYYFDDSRKLKRIEFVDNNKIISEIILQNPCEVNVLKLKPCNIKEKTLELIKQGKKEQEIGYNGDGTKHIELFYRTDGSTLEKVKFYYYNKESDINSVEFILKNESKLTKDDLFKYEKDCSKILSENSKIFIQNKQNGGYSKTIKKHNKSNKEITYIIEDSPKEYKTAKQIDDGQKIYIFTKSNDRYIFHSKLVVDNDRQGILYPEYLIEKEKQNKILNKYKKLEEEFDEILGFKTEKQVSK